MADAKPFGYELLDIRIGGVITRLKSAGRRIERYLAGDIMRLEELEEKKDSLKNEIIVEESNRSEVSRRDLLNLFRKYRNKDKNDIDYRKQLIKNFVDKIYLYDDKFYIVYNGLSYHSEIKIEEIDNLYNNQEFESCNESSTISE